MCACVCVCVCVCVREREKERERETESSNAGERHPRGFLLGLLHNSGKRNTIACHGGIDVRKFGCFFLARVYAENAADGNAALHKSPHTFPGFDTFFLKKRFLVMFRTKRIWPRGAVEYFFPLSCYVGWRQNCGVQCLYIVVKLQTNTGWQETVKGVKAPRLVSTIHWNPLLPPAPESLTIQYLLAPIGMVHKGSVCVCVCVLVPTSDRLTKAVCVGDREGKIKADFLLNHRYFLPPLQPNAEGSRILLLFSWLSERKEKIRIFFL